MAYDEKLAARIREALSESGDLSERKMFGGIAFLLGGHMVCGVIGDDLMVRVGPAAHQWALTLPHARPMDFTGRPSKGMVYVAPAGCKTSKTLATWLARATTFVQTLPARATKRRPRAR